MDIRSFLNKNIGRRLQLYLDNNNLKNGDAIRKIQLYNNDEKNDIILTQSALSKILNGKKQSLSKNNLNDIANKIMDDSFEYIVFGDDNDKLYFIRILLYNLIANGLLFNQQELEEIHENAKFQKLSNSTLEYWVISITQTPKIKKIAELLFYSLLQDAKFSQLYFKKIYEEHNVLKEYSNIILNLLQGKDTSKIINSILLKPMKLQDDIDFFILFFNTFNTFITDNQELLLNYFNNIIGPKISNLIFNEEKFMLKFKDKFFIDQFTSDEFIKVLEITITKEGEEGINFMSLYMLEKKLIDYRKSLYKTDFDYSILDDID